VANARHKPTTSGTRAASAAKKAVAKKAVAKKAVAKKAVAKKAVAKKAVAKKAVAKKAVGASGARRTVPKTQATDAAVTAFLERVADPARRAECVALNRLLSEVAGAPPRMWGSGIVGFGQYRHRYSNGSEGDWPVCGYSPRKQDLVVYVMAGVERFPDILSRLGRCKTGKSCLYLRALSDIDADVLRELVAASSEQLRRMYG
jgi:hypothetical protein